MFSLLSKFFIGSFEDQVYLNTFGWWSKMYMDYNGSLFKNLLIGPYGFFYELKTTNQPLLWHLVSLGYRLFDQVAFYNFLVIAIATLNLLVSFVVFYKISESRAVSILQALIFAFSSYFWIHAGRHLDLSIGFFIIIYFYQLHKLIHSHGRVKYWIWLAVITVVQMLVSNYYGFFMLLTTGITYIALLTFGVFNKERTALRTTKFFVLYTVLAASITIPLLYPYIDANILKSDKPASSPLALNRTYEDFFYFSTRPWYYLLPSVKNPIWGPISQNVLDRLSASNYFLFFNYFHDEHASSFLGFELLTIFFLSLYLYLYTNRTSRRYVLVFLTVLGILFMLSLPPYFTVSEKVIYTPGHLMWDYFPMFRATGRLSIFILAGILVISTNAYKLVLGSKNIYLKTLTFVSLALFALTEHFVPIKVHNVSQVPAIYVELSSLPANSTVAFYPQDMRDLFWLKDFRHTFINPYGYRSPGFDSEPFTKSLLSTEGLEEAKRLGVTHLVVSESTDAERIHFLDSSELLQIYGAVDGRHIYSFK